MENNFFSMGQSDCLRHLPANPMGAGTDNPQQYSEYMNGYNSALSHNQESFIRVAKEASKRVSDFYEATLKRKKEKKDLPSLKKRLDAHVSKLQRRTSSRTAHLENRLALADIQDMQKVNESEAGMYTTQINFFQLEGKSPEDLIKGLEGFILQVEGEREGEITYRQPENFIEASRYFIGSFLVLMNGEEYSSKILPEDEAYLKFVQALNLFGRKDIADICALRYNRLQKTLEGAGDAKKLKQILKVGSRYGYGIVLQ